MRRFAFVFTPLVDCFSRTSPAKFHDNVLLICLYNILMSFTPNISGMIILARPSTKVHAAPGGHSTFSLSYDEPPKTEVEDKKEVEEVAPTEEEAPAKAPLSVKESFRANRDRGQSSNIFGTDAAPSSAPVSSRSHSSKGGQSSINFGESAPASTSTPRSNKLGESSIEFGASDPAPSASGKGNKTSESSIQLGVTEPAKHTPRITPTHQSSIKFGEAGQAPASPAKTTNKSIMSTLNLAHEPEAAAPTSARPSSRQAPGGRTSIVLG
jgi:hypothetical protein